ncbi:1,4-alpha-glucan branching protein GlgB [Bacillus sp. 2205SS5-2]|uniref:1,4-alpha-glucan branching protein GlgB n=1 Tax=Bacillus sp. 2205SS5-2 TaxID=3109031 RepID=UPI003007CF48
MTTIYPSPYDIHLFHEGQLFEAYLTFGAHVLKTGDALSTTFCVWAPNAETVSVVGSFNSWKADELKMKKITESGIWFVSYPSSLKGHVYKYQILTNDGKTLLKTDPFSFFAEKRPNTAGIICGESEFKWDDEHWLFMRRKEPVYDKPLFIYEIHLGTWKVKGKELFYTYAEIADELVPYLVEHGYTHVEIMPITEHPFDRSWGYQSTGYFSPTSRYGTPDDLRYLINKCHLHNIGVILDWVPGHFCKDEHGLYRFDGSYLFDYSKEHDRENYLWGTANFDLGKNEVQSFLISSARYWLEEFHVDGFRIDAVANILYWANQESLVPNEGAIDFLKKLNSAIFEVEPNALMMAEDSTDWPQVTSPVHYGGLGFNYKWNMGWMNDVLKYMETYEGDRKHVHSLLTFSLLYAFSENYVLPLSHDEVVHGKKSLLSKMPGDYWQKFAQLRLLLGYLVAHPGKKLLFMGTELAPFSEWKDLDQIDWHLEDYDMHKAFNAYIKELLHFYREINPFFEKDHLSDGFEWIDVDNNEQSILSFMRKGKKKEDFVIVICNFTSNVYHHYKVGVPNADYYIELFNSDHQRYGGSGQINENDIAVVSESFHDRPKTVEITIPPFAVVYLQPVYQVRGERT